VFHHAAAPGPIGPVLWGRWAICVNFALTEFSEVHAGVSLVALCLLWTG
jgi:hypothetical protein